MTEIINLIPGCILFGIPPQGLNDLAAAASFMRYHTVTLSLMERRLLFMANSLTRSVSLVPPEFSDCHSLSHFSSSPAVMLTSLLNLLI